MVKSSFRVKGMHCRSCEMLITDSLTDAGAKKVEVSHQSGSLTVEHNDNLSDKKIRELVKAEGYEVE